MSDLRVQRVRSLDGSTVEFVNGVSGDADGLRFDPKIIAYNPVALTTNLSVSTTQFSFTFDQPIEFSGIGTIKIIKSSDSSVYESFTCGVSAGATIAGSVLQVNTSNGNFDFFTNYIIDLPSVGIANTYGQYYKGSDGYTFRTGSSVFDVEGGDISQVVVAPGSPTGYYKYNIFTTSGIATFSGPSASATDFAYVLVGGGGGGGTGGQDYDRGGGGGGAGGHIYNYNSGNLPAGTYTVTIGSGGSGTFSNPGGTEAPPTQSPTGNLPVVTTSGSNSSFGPTPVGNIVAYGGGAGGLGNFRSNPVYSANVTWNNSGTEPTSGEPAPSNPDYVYTPLSRSPSPAEYPIPANQWGCGGAPGGSGGGHSSAFPGNSPSNIYSGPQGLGYNKLNVTGQSGVGYPGPNQQGYPGGSFYMQSSTSSASIMGSGGGGAGSAGGQGGTGPNGWGPRPGSGGSGKASPVFPGPGLSVLSGFPSTLAAEMGPTGLLAGGGGGSIYVNGAPSSPGDVMPFANGGPGGGGDGGGRSLPTAPAMVNRSATRGVANTGGGGGSGPASGSPGGTYPTPGPGTWYGQNGGSGIMMIRFAHPGS